MCDIQRKSRNTKYPSRGCGNGASLECIYRRLNYENIKLGLLESRITCVGTEKSDDGREENIFWVSERTVDGIINKDAGMNYLENAGNAHRGLELSMAKGTVPHFFPGIRQRLFSHIKRI